MPNQRANMASRLTKSSLSLKSQTPQKIIKTIYNFKYHLLLVMMLFTWVLCTWDHQRVKPQGLSSTLVLSILPSLLHYVMTRPQETLSSRNMILCQDPSFRETSWTNDARLRLMTWRSQTPTRSFQRHHPSLLTVQPNSKVSFGKTMLVSSHLREIPPSSPSSKCN